MKLIFFWKWPTFFVDLENPIKICEKLLGFWDNSIWTFSRNFSYLSREYLRSAINVLPSSPKISDLTKVDIFQLNFSSINRKLGWKCFSTGSSSVWQPSTSLLPKCVLKQEITAIEVTTFVGVNHFRNIWAMKLNFFLTMTKMLCRFRKRNEIIPW